MDEIVLQVLAANIAAGLAVMAALALRGPVRAIFGASVAYALWLLVPMVALATLLPPRTVEIIQPTHEAAVSTNAAPPAPEPVATFSSRTARHDATSYTAPERIVASATPAAISGIRLPPVDPWSLAALVWLAGVALSLTWQVRNQSRFMAQARRGMAGPAVAGLLRPQIVTPTNFEQKFDARERAIIIAHERVHIDRNDARINAVAALFRCLCWFNPLIHVAAHFMRIDQELACDAAVTERYPRSRAVYASALLKAQLAAWPLPAGCYWPPKAGHALVERIEMLEVAIPGRRARLAGAVVLALLAAGSGLAAWAAKPPATKYATTSVQPDPPRQGAAPSGAAAYDPADPVYLRGKVERIDFGETKYTVYVRASSLGASETGETKPDKRLWELTPTPYWGDRDAVNADLKDRFVTVRGYGARDKSCAPVCKLLMRGILVPGSTELPAVAPSGRFGVTEVNRIYDLGQTLTIEGKVQSIRFSDRILDAYVVTPANGLVPGHVFQVRSEYRFPRADIEKELLNQVVLVNGWPARDNVVGMDLDVWSTYSKCETACAMYGRNFTREDGAKVAPAEDQLLPEPLSTDPFFVRLPTPMQRETGVTLTGKVKEVKSMGDSVELVVEETSRTPSPFIGPRPGTVWTVWLRPENFNPEAPSFAPWNDIIKARSWTGHTLTFSGTVGPTGSTSNVRTCETNCKFLASNVMVFDR